MQREKTVDAKVLEPTGGKEKEEGEEGRNRSEPV